MKYTVKLTNGEVFEHLTRGLNEQWQETWNTYIFRQEDKTYLLIPRNSIYYRKSEPTKK